ncbi:DAD family protein [Ancylostoma caninum]|uniref:Dolichyl-diphosphooligosaccharide--protein glycosyltransferase subunit DAD1 n=1 Tax=Ancylostoma caninum TaxID=29170 RepID=A0A368FGF9_ANCCA|nr:DAD family protein [Ancylostoma caninum]
MQAVQVLQKLFEDYKRTTPGKLKIIDAYMLYILLTGIAQVSNNFGACLISCTSSEVTSFVLASYDQSEALTCLRIQVNEDNKSEFSHISPERAFADFIFAHAVLHLVVANFLG